MWRWWWRGFVKTAVNTKNQDAKKPKKHPSFAKASEGKQNPNKNQIINPKPFSGGIGWNLML
jgi:hypothetical protein